jgi:hypothetical protein
MSGPQVFVEPMSTPGYVGSVAVSDTAVSVQQAAVAAVPS